VRIPTFQPAIWSLVSAVLSAASLLVGIVILGVTQHLFNFIVPLFAAVLFLIVSFGLGIFSLVKSLRTKDTRQMKHWLIWAFIIAFLTLATVVYWWPVGV
jgi:hypothetical protein